MELERNVDIKELEKQTKVQSKLNEKWNRRHYYHYAINLCFFVCLIINWLAYKAQVFSIYSYDLFDFTKKNLYANGNFTYFKFHPYSHFVVNCNPINGIENKTFTDNYFFNYFQIGQTQDFLAKNLKNVVTMNNSRIFSSYKEFEEMNVRINNMSLNEFKAINKAGEEVFWDTEEEEQINYFLHPLKKYKYLKPERN